ncbi:MAG: (2Fe-2S)-binding protein [Planctomycetes bacterium]|nr:(2Fe-2S)-binding protein [Planctomycetota bacterium]
MRFELNGEEVRVEVEPATTLLDLLRDRLDLTGSKRVCDRGSCGAYTVQVNGRAVAYCSILAVDVTGQKVRTIEGLSSAEGELSPLQQAFVDHDALQCGFCTPGMVMSCQALLERNPKPDRPAIAAGIAGNICRCGTYQNVFEAVEQASGQGGGK